MSNETLNKDTLRKAPGTTWMTISNRRSLLLEWSIYAKTTYLKNYFLENSQCVVKNGYFPQILTERGADPCRECEAPWGSVTLGHYNII